ncbi:ATP-binding cassette domain-containing protein [Chitinophaga sedimenti]|uniref:ATP-binding cassette domain-containing protein n=1 Tax=Chitinophaga sedimenti TaxID=2033606 RepID=UPI002005830E|nr:ATP-binding cassette domain-containing protein [Chitinophaga sedimenti]MCK7557869.1 ATP-binding cassette domain-containing protein [Chitinophaga sedimenti]
MIELVNVKKGFGDKEILKDVSVTMEAGKMNLIIGASGSGKTVMMKCMVGLMEVDSGEIRYGGKNFSAMDNNQRKEIRKEIGMLFRAQPCLIP